MVPSLVPRPSPAPVYDRLQFAYCKRSKPGAGEGLGTRLVVPTSEASGIFPVGVAMHTRAVERYESVFQNSPLLYAVADLGGGGGEGGKGGAFAFGG